MNGLRNSIIVQVTASWWVATRKLLGGFPFPLKNPFFFLVWYRAKLKIIGSLFPHRCVWWTMSPACWQRTCSFQPPLIKTFNFGNLLAKGRVSEFDSWQSFFCYITANPYVSFDLIRISLYPMQWLSRSAWWRSSYYWYVSSGIILNSPENNKGTL